MKSFPNMLLERRLRRSIPLDDWSSSRWDQEWVNYLRNAGLGSYLVKHDELEPAGSLEGLAAPSIFETSLTTTKEGDLGRSFNWVDGLDLLGDTLEIGCGPGWLGKQLGLIGRSYLGVDYSSLALKIAEVVSPQTCDYGHISELGAIVRRAGPIDTMIGRHFFIHQNYQNVQWLLGLARTLLRPGGLVSADSWLTDPENPRGVVHPAKFPLDDTYASCAFEFTEPEIHELAESKGFEVMSVIDRPDVNRRFVILTKS